MLINGNKIKQERERKGVKQIVLAQVAGVTQSALSQVESGFTQLEKNKVEKIANFLEVPIKHFYGEGYNIEINNVHNNTNGIYIESENKFLKEQIEILKISNLQKDDLIKELNHIIQEQKEKIKRKNSKIEELK